MKNLVKLNILFAFVLIISACFNQEENLSEDEFNTITIKNEYSVDIPTYMTTGTDLNEDASLQYQNIFKETYVIVIDEPKDEYISVFKGLGAYDENTSVLKNYSDGQQKYFVEGVTVTNKGEVQSLKINGLDAEMIEVDGTVPEIQQEIAYFLTFIEGKDNLYSMMAWTLKSKKDKYRATFQKMARSFKELNSK